MLDVNKYLQSPLQHSSWRFSPWCVQHICLYVLFSIMSRTPKEVTEWRSPRSRFLWISKSSRLYDRCLRSWSTNAFDPILLMAFVLIDPRLWLHSLQESSKGFVMFLLQTSNPGILGFYNRWCRPQSTLGNSILLTFATSDRSWTAHSTRIVPKCQGRSSSPLGQISEQDLTEYWANCSRSDWRLTSSLSTCCSWKLCHIEKLLLVSNVSNHKIQLWFSFICRAVCFHQSPA